MRKTSVVVFIFIMLSLLQTSTAQEEMSLDDGWSLWLYNPDHNAIAHIIAGTGEAEIFLVSSLGDFPVEVSAYSDQDIALNADENRIAYCTVEAAVLCSDSSAALIVHDLDDDEIVSHVCLPHNTPCILGDSPWADKRVAFSYRNTHLLEENKPSWAVQVFDVDTQTLSTVFDQFDNGIRIEETPIDPSESAMPIRVSFTSEDTLTVHLFCNCHGGGARGINRPPIIEWDISDKATIAN